MPADATGSAGCATETPMLEPASISAHRWGGNEQLLDVSGTDFGGYNVVVNPPSMTKSAPVTFPARSLAAEGPGRQPPGVESTGRSRHPWRPGLRPRQVDRPLPARQLRPHRRFQAKAAW